MRSQAVVFNSPKQLSLQALDLPELQAGQLDVAVEYSGISTGTERMLWDGSMPPFPTSRNQRRLALDRKSRTYRLIFHKHHA